MTLQLQSPLYNKSSIIFTGIIIHILGLQRQYCTATVADKNVCKKSLTLTVRVTCNGYTTASVKSFMHSI